MKTLETLSKVAAKKVEEKQKEIVSLQRVVDQMKARKKQLASSIEAEYSVAHEAGDVNVMRMAGGYHQRADAELKDIAEAMADADKIMQDKRADLQKLFAEQKRYDILLERRKVEAKKEQMKKEQAALDEMGGVKHNK